MTPFHRTVLVLTSVSLFLAIQGAVSWACCPAYRFNQPVVNADQTVLIIWDAAAKTQHFVRKATFKGEAEDFGFIVPSPSQPELSESGGDAFDYLAQITAPEVEQKRGGGGGGMGCGCAAQQLASKQDDKWSVRVLDEKVVAGYRAAVLEANDANALVTWLKDNGYAYSAAIEAWAKPYVEQGWKFTALKVEKKPDDKNKKSVATGTLRLSFKTDRPLFPYREPDPRSAAEAVEAKDRLLRIYLVADARFTGELGGKIWPARVAWSNKLKAEQRKELLKRLQLPETTGPAEWWLTEFEDAWAFDLAPGDVYFGRDRDQTAVKRPPVTRYVAAPWPMDVATVALAVALVMPPLVRRAWPRRNGRK